MRQATRHAALSAAIVALAVGAVPASSAERATVSVRPSSDVVARGARLRVAVKVRGATEQAIGDSIAGSVTVTLRPRDGGRAVRREVFVAPEEDGSRDVTIGLNVPRSARPGRYGLSAVLFGQDGETEYARSASVLVRVR